VVERLAEAIRIVAVLAFKCLSQSVALCFKNQSDAFVVIQDLEKSCCAVVGGND
jgi:hypothetical protein